MGRFKELLNQGKTLILHGALGTELEYRGYDVSGKLWSAKYLLKNPRVIKEIHKDYILAGSDIVTTSTYQATFPGLKEVGLSEKEIENIIRLTVALAKEARDEVWNQLTDEEKNGRIYPLISGDVGPYAAFLADGSEYTGAYGDVSKDDLKNFHRPRIQLLLEEGVELLAVETIPNLLEIESLLELLEEEFPQVEAYLSVTTQDGQTLSDGSSIEKIAELVNQSDNVVAVGLNCSSPTFFNEFLSCLRQLTEKPFVTYPNSGEVYDGATQTWHETADTSHTLLENSIEWRNLGTQILGGCCRTRPSDIFSLRKGLQ